MGRWNNYNDVEYKGWNLSRRDLFETVCYDSAYYVLEYIKHFYDTKKPKEKPYVVFKRLYNFLEFLYECKENISVLNVDDNIAEDFMYHITNKVSSTEVTMTMYKIYRFYDYLIINELIKDNPFTKVKKLAYHIDCKRRQLSTNFISDEQMKKIKKEAPFHLKVYALFTISSGVDINIIRKARWEHVDFNKRMIQFEGKKFFFSEEALSLLKQMQDIRKKKGLNDSGYIFRSHIDGYCKKTTPLSKSTVCKWCSCIGDLIGIPNLRHLDLRHSAVRRFLSKSGSTGMTEVLMNYVNIHSKKKQYVVEENNSDLLQEYKDLCEI